MRESILNFLRQIASFGGSMQVSKSNSMIQEALRYGYVEISEPVEKRDNRSYTDVQVTLTPQGFDAIGE